MPPTDHVINMKVLVEYDEHSIWNGGNINPGARNNPNNPIPKPNVPDTPNLVSIYKKYKIA